MNECPLVSWLAQQHLEQRDLARKLRAPESSLSAYIHGKRGFRLRRFQRLSEITGISLDDLVAWTAQNQSKRRPSSS